MTNGEPIDLRTDGWFKFAIGAIWFCGAAYILLGLVLGPLGGLGLLSGAGGPGAVGAPEAAVSVAFSMLMLGICVVVGVGNFLVAHALQKRKKWGWVGGLVVGGIYAPSGCCMFGIPILYALLRSGIREAYQREALQAEGVVR